MATAPPRLNTLRLTLRPPDAGDFDAYAAFMANPATAEPIGGVQPRSVAWRSFTSLAGAWSLHGFAMFSVIEKSTGRWIGRVGPWRPEGWPGTEVGWGIVQECWGRGYATEAATAAIDWAIDALGWTDIIHVIAPTNAPSQAVARKLGSRNRGRGSLPVPHADTIVDLWGQSAADWRCSHRKS
ncbi:MAG: GNAT family N-acetyltransferase [Gammaproteobacteria bacterium]